MSDIVNVRKVLILDGYTDEPAGLGVPPYIDVYPRYIAGAIWSIDKTIMIKYLTVDQARMALQDFIKEASSYDIIIVVAGVTVPGKYLGGTPISLRELDQWFRVINKPLKILVGPAAKFGIGEVGGRVAELPSKVKENFDYIVKGDPEIFIYNLLRYGEEKTSPYITRRDYTLTNKFAIKGSRIVVQHPNYGLNLIVEIETFRGCPRSIVGGCSFCIEPGYGLPVFREPEDVVREVEALGKIGVEHFRIGRQPDLLAYKGFDSGKVEFPKPNIRAIEKLFKGIRSVVPNLRVLHIDNINPGTIVHHVKESIEVLKIIVKYHTSGDVAALGIETADPKVVKLNNLKVYPEEALEAIRIINKIGAHRGENGLPELLPGINFVHGLIGETKETYILNYLFLKRILDEGLLIRRINIRQVIAFPSTRMWIYGDKIIKRNKKYFKIYKDKIRREIDLPMLRRVVPRGTILKGVFTEKYRGTKTLGRQVGSYPLLIEISKKVSLNKWIDILVIDHGFRSVTGLPIPLNINNATVKELEIIPGMTKQEVLEIISKRPFKSLDELRRVLRDNLLNYFTI